MVGKRSQHLWEVFLEMDDGEGLRDCGGVGNVDISWGSSSGTTKEEIPQPHITRLV